MSRTPILALLAATCVAPGPALAAESFDNCAGFITSLPAIITTQGVWCMDRDLATASTTGHAIQVDTSNVTIDCNSYKLGNLAAGPGTEANGIIAVGRRNVTVRGCNIRGFHVGVRFDGVGAGHVVEDNRIEGSTWAGLLLEGDNLIVRRNQIIDSGGTTVAPQAYGYGIAVEGRALIDDNLVSGVDSTGSYEAVGVILFNGPGGTIRDNAVVGVKGADANTNYAVIIHSSGVAVHGNTLLGDGTSSTGVLCAQVPVGVRDNSIGRFTVGMHANCVDQDNQVF